MISHGQPQDCKTFGKRVACNISVARALLDIGTVMAVVNELAVSVEANMALIEGTEQERHVTTSIHVVVELMDYSARLVKA